MIRLHHEFRESNSCHQPVGAGGGQFCSAPTASGSSITAYHGTHARALDDILREGLTVTHSGEQFDAFSKPGYTYVTTDPLDAAHWAGEAQRLSAAHVWRETPPEEKAQQPDIVRGMASTRDNLPLAVLQVQIPYDAWVKLAPDEHFIKHDLYFRRSTGTQFESIEGEDYDKIDAPEGHVFNPTGRLQFSGNIKPEWITAAWVTSKGEHSDRVGLLKQVKGAPQPWPFRESQARGPVTLYIVTRVAG